MVDVIKSLLTNLGYQLYTLGMLWIALLGNALLLIFALKTGTTLFFATINCYLSGHIDVVTYAHVVRGRTGI